MPEDFSHRTHKNRSRALRTYNGNNTEMRANVTRTIYRAQSFMLYAAMLQAQRCMPAKAHEQIGRMSFTIVKNKKHDSRRGCFLAGSTIALAISC